MNIEESKIILQSNIISLKTLNDPSIKIPVTAMENILNYLIKLEKENQELKSKIMIKEMPGGGE